jgi:hypothetical protein
MFTQGHACLEHHKLTASRTATVSTAVNTAAPGTVCIDLKLHKEVGQIAALYRGTSERQVSRREHHSNLK